MKQPITFRIATSKAFERILKELKRVLQTKFNLTKTLQNELPIPLQTMS